MIFTVFAAAPAPANQWRAELLAYSWRRLHQPGELIRLVPMAPGQVAPRHVAARIVETLAWNPHPYTGDEYSGYELPTAVQEWLFREPVEGTVLLLGSHMVLQRAVNKEATAGQVLAMPWADMPNGKGGPFGLDAKFGFLERYCVNRELPLAPVRLPILIHTGDLRKIAARWAELTAILRADYVGRQGRLADADRIAYAIAAAEYRLRHGLMDLGVGTAGDSNESAVIDYSRPIESPRGEIVWDDQVYEPWGDVYPEKARPGAGRDFLALLNELATRRQAGTDMSAIRPLRRVGVREARILDDLHLEVPDCPDPIVLNHSAAAIWELCDGKRTLAEIVGELERRFDVPRDTLSAAVESTTKELETAGALELEDLL